MTRPLLAAVLLVPALAAADTPFPIPCRELSALWTGARGTTYAPRGYHEALRADWAKRELRCDLLDAGNLEPLLQKELVDITVARAAYILDANRWARSSSVFRRAIAPDDWTSGPPESMFNWVRLNSSKLVYSSNGSGAARNPATGIIYLGKDNFSVASLRKGTDGIGLALQLAHEAQHGKGGHVLCPWQQAGDDPACDSSVMEQFTHIPSRGAEGGSHGFSSLYATWIAQYSDWPPAYRRLAKDVALWVMGCASSAEFFAKGNLCGNRINDAKAADAFTCRYFGVHHTAGNPPCRRR